MFVNMFVFVFVNGVRDHLNVNIVRGSPNFRVPQGRTFSRVFQLMVRFKRNIVLLVVSLDRQKIENGMCIFICIYNVFLTLNVNQIINMISTRHANSHEFI